MHPVDDDPLMASAIGRCSNAWTHCETALTWTFSHLTSTDYAVAVTVFSFFKSTRTQRDVIRKVARLATFMTDDLTVRLNDYLKQYLALAEGRNELLHNPIGRSVENQVYIMLRSKAPIVGQTPYTTKPISPSEIDDLAASIKRVARGIYDVNDDIGKARFPSHSSLFGTLLPDPEQS